MLPVDLFRRPVFALSVATAICAHGAQLIAFVALPFYFQYVSGLSPIQIGVLITPWPAALVVMAPIAGRLADRYPAGLLGGFGLAVMTLGLLLVLFAAITDPHRSMWPGGSPSAASASGSSNRPTTA